jgi:hypothetical protein
MTDRSKFEQMLEHLVNEDTEKAQEIFHQLVVEKSREIYENILAEDFEIDEEKDEDDEEMDESKMSDDEDEEVEENFGFGEADDDIGGDPTDDMIDDMGMDDEGDMGDDMSMDDEGDMGGDEELEDRVVDLEDAIDDLRAEFEKLMGEEGDDMGDDMSMDDEGDMGDDMSMDDEEDAKESYEDNFMREYIEKVGNPKHGDNGANAKSTVAGKNDMGGTAGNITSGGESTKGGTQGGLLNPSTKDINSGNINVPGGNAGKTAFKKKEPGHGAEKKSTGDNGDRGSDSPINGIKSRAK